MDQSVVSVHVIACRGGVCKILGQMSYSESRVASDRNNVCNFKVGLYIYLESRIGPILLMVHLLPALIFIFVMVWYLIPSLPYINDRVTIMARLKFIGLFTFSHGGNQNQQGGRVPFMRLAALCSGLADTVVWQRCCRKLTYRACRPHPIFYASGSVCNLAPF